MTDQIIRLVGTSQRDSLLRIVQNLPLDGSMECCIRPVRKVRSLPQNALMWAARLKDISQQAWVDGRQFSEEVWHEHLKREYLPEGDEEDLGKLVKDPEKYRKWAILPSGERDLVGSTTQLTKYGFSQYMMQVEAWAAQELGVRFTEVKS